ncbi:MAG: hypothetical protein AB1742_12530 [bacterium]
MDESELIQKLKQKAGGRRSIRFAGEEENGGLSDAVYEIFGGWQEALAAAGLHPKTKLVGYWSHSEVIKRIRQIAGRGESLNTLHLEHRHPRLWNAARRLFGNIENAVESAGFDYKKIRKRDEWSEERIREEIRELFSRGVDISQVTMAQVNSKLLAAGQKFYGSWSRAVETAGIEYSRVRQAHRTRKQRKKTIEEGLKKRRVFIVRNGTPVEFKKTLPH